MYEKSEMELGVVPNNYPRTNILKLCGNKKKKIKIA